jgi:hypothetical protein
MSLKIYSTLEKVTAKDERIIQQAGDTDGVIASFYDLSGNPSLFLDGTLAHLGNVGIKTATPNEALTVVGNVSTTENYYGSSLSNLNDDLYLTAGGQSWSFGKDGSLTLPTSGILQANNGSNIYIGSNLIPTTSAFYIGDINNPVNGIYLAAHTLYIASNISGTSGLELTNVDNIFTVAKGGLRSTEIYTGGLFISGNNIGADPSAGFLPMTIGTAGLPAVQVLVPLTVHSTISALALSGTHYGDGSNLTGVIHTQYVLPTNTVFSSVSALALSGTHYGDGSHLINLPTSNPFDQSLNTTNNVRFSSLSLTDGLTAHYTTIIGDLSCTGRIYAGDVHAPLSVTDLTTTTKTLALSDVNSIITGSSTSDMTVTIPLNSNVPFPVGTEIKFIQLGTKKIILTGASGVNLANISNQFKTKGQHAVAWLFQVSANQWIYAGDTSP